MIVGVPLGRVGGAGIGSRKEPTVVGRTGAVQLCPRGIRLRMSFNRLRPLCPPGLYLANYFTGSKKLKWTRP